jgi:hypothetical protein
MGDYHLGLLAEAKASAIDEFTLPNVCFLFFSTPLALHITLSSNQQQATRFLFFSP